MSAVAPHSPIIQRHVMSIGANFAASMQIAVALLWWLLFSKTLWQPSVFLWLLLLCGCTLASAMAVRSQANLPQGFASLNQRRWYFTLSTCSGILWGHGVLLLGPGLSEAQILLLLLMVALFLGFLLIPNLLSIRSFNGAILPLMVALAWLVFDASTACRFAYALLVLVVLQLNWAMRLVKQGLWRRFEQHFFALERLDALENDQVLLRQQSELDSLTQVYNRAMFERLLARHWRFAGRAHTCISLLMIDVDYFKTYNDHYGHLGGDQCLCAVAQVLDKALHREDDVLARFGGEEFVMILPNTDTQGAQLVAKRIKDYLAQAQLIHHASPVAGYVTASIGICCLTPTPKSDSVELLEKADRALYRAKQLGRNQAVVAARGESQ